MRYTKQMFIDDYNKLIRFERDSSYTKDDEEVFDQMVRDIIKNIDSIAENERHHFSKITQNMWEAMYNYDVGRYSSEYRRGMVDAACCDLRKFNDE